MSSGDMGSGDMGSGDTNSGGASAGDTNSGGAGAGGGAIAVLDTGVTFDDDGTAYPTAVVDVSDRPDVADLPRVHAQEGIGDLTTTLEVTAAGVALTVRLTSPVRAWFTVAFELPAHRGVLVAAARSNQLLLATTTPEPIGEHPTWLAIDLDGHRLGELLDRLDRPGPRSGGDRS